MKNKHHSRWIFLLLALLLLISLSLAWQSAISVSSHQQTVNAVLQDYAELMLDDFIGSTQRYVGYENLWAAKTGLETSGLMSADLQHWSAEQLEEALQNLQFPPGWLKGVFRIMREQPQRAVWLYGDVDTYLSAQMVDRLKLASGPFRIFHFRHGGGYGMQVTLQDTSLRALVLVTDPAIFHDLFATVFANTDLLPASLTTSEVLKSLLHLTVHDPGNSIVFEQGTEIEYAIQASRVMDDSYSGLFAGFRITIDVEPGLAASLALGSPPWQNMTRVALLLVTSLILVIATVIMIRRERQLMEMRAEFIARVSHELRTPLTQIRMFTESILLGRLPESADQRRALDIIDRETLRLSRLVENILSFSRSRAKALPAEAEDYALLGLLQRIQDEFGPLMKVGETQLEIVCDVDIAVRYNRDAVSQILTNLLDNALKYGPAGHTINIKAEVTADGLTISVADQGPGIPVADQQRIWEAYFRLEREQGRGIAGTGIGLAVARDLATGLGADLELDSNDTGSTFTIRFIGQGDIDG